MKTYKTDCLLTRTRFVGCTLARHREIGVHAQINARAGELWRNASHLGEKRSLADLRLDELDLWYIRNCNRRHYQWRTRWFRKRYAHLLADRNEF